MTILHNILFPDPAALVGRKWLKDGGTYNVTSPAGALFLLVSLVSSGGEGQDLGGNGAFVFKKISTVAGELFTIQVGMTHSSGNPGNSLITRVSTGEILAFADRGRGSGQVQGQAANCIGDFAESGQLASRAGGDSSRVAQLIGPGGRYAAMDPKRACGPGGGGRGGSWNGLTTNTHTAGQGVGVCEWYSGDPLL